MSPIGTVGYSPRITTSRRVRRQTAPAPFTLPAENTEAPISEVSGLTPIALLSLQEEAGAVSQEEQEREAVTWGGDVLSALRELQVSLLEGRIPADILTQIETLCTQEFDMVGSGLSNVVRSIRVRAIIEAAKSRRRIAEQNFSIPPQEEEIPEGGETGSCGRETI